MQKMKVFRRLMVLLLIVCLLAGNAVQAVGMSQQNTAVSVQKEQTGSIDTAAAQKALTERREQAGLIRASADQLDPDQEIRVIVEMEAQPAVQSVVVQSTGAKLNAQLQSVETKALHAQQTVIHSAKAITGNDAIQQTAYLVNTFSMNMTPAEMAEVAELPGVKSVSPVTTFEMKMNYASHMTTVYKMWEEMGYTGEGTVIAVLDSGVNYHHPDMKLSDGAKIRITENDAKALIQKLGYGTYYSDKVPFAYSYSGYYEMDNHSNTHGLHVSGIAAGNGGDTGITGVAPNAQILGLQVFGMGNSAFTDDIIRAVEDAVKLGADIMNLSLGSTAGFYDDVAYLQSALQSATDDGVLCCVAAGNDGSSASLLGINTNDFGVVDSGAVSAPSTTPGVLSVASVNNTYLKGNTLSLTDAAGTTHEATVFNFSQLYNTVREENPGLYGWETLKDVLLVDCGYGTISELFGSVELPTDGSKWVAVVQRGEISFEEKINFCYMVGASGVVIYNNEPGSEVPFNVGSGDAATSWSKICQIMVSNDFGKELTAIAAKGDRVTFHELETKFLAASDGGEMSTFSSWGPTPSLDIKPEISAPGGNIYSISSGDGYESMSGTSMATPYVSGGAALTLQAVKDAQENGELSLKGMSVNEYLKLALMNTADIICQPDSTTPYSVRQQGSGMVDPLGAAKTRVLASCNGLGGAALKQIGTTASFTVTLTNYGTQPQTYTLTPDALYTNCIEADNVDTIKQISGAQITYNASSVTVPAGGKASVNATVNVGSAEYNHYVEGFTVLHGDGCEDLSLPVLAFYGDWYGCENIIDAPSYTGESIYYETTGYPSTGVGAGQLVSGVTAEGEINPAYISFSPNGDRAMEETFPLLGMLRSAQTLRVEVTDETGTPLRTIISATQIPKLLGADITSAQAAYTMLTISDYYALTYGDWDGTVYNARTGKYELCPEGQYYFLVTATMPGSTQKETIKLPVKLDITAPEIDVVSADYENNALTVTFRAEDNVGVYGEIEVYVNGEGEYVMLSDCAYDEADGLYTCSLEEPSAYRVGEMNEIGVFAQDYAMNNTTAYLYTGVDASADIVYATLTNAEDSWFDSFQLYDRSDLGEMYSEDEIAELAFDWDIRGSVSARVASLTIDGENVAITAKHSFAVKKSIQPGENEFKVIAKDASGKILVQETKLLYLSTKAGVTARIYPECYPDHMAELCPETNRPANAWLDQAGFWSSWKNSFGYLTHYKTVAPLVFECSDPIKEVSIIYYDPDQTLAGDALMKSYDETIYMEDVKYKTMTLTQEDFVDGKAAFDMPMVPWDLDMSDYINIDPADYPDTRVNECYITVTNVLGVKSYYFVRVENDDICRLNEDRDRIEDMNILDDPDSIVSLMGFEWIKPMDDMQFPFVFTPEDLDSEGRIHVTGKAADDAVLEVYANGEYVSLDDPMEFAFDFKLNVGVNYMSIFTVEDFGTTSSTTYRLFYLPEPTTLSFDQAGVADGATIYTTDSTFLLSGDVTSYFAGRELAINGDNVIFEDGAMSTPAGKRHVASFEKKIALELGENVVTVEMVDAAGLKVKITFTIIRREKEEEPEPDLPIIIPVLPGSSGSKFPFTDVKPSDPYYDAVKYLYEKNIMNGTSNTLFSPNAELTRGMVVTILYRMEGEPATKNSGTFSDVKTGRYYSEAVEWAAENSIVNGFTDGSFKPERAVTREQLASILCRYARFSGITTYEAKLPANASVSSWAAKDVAWAYAEGILNAVQTAAAAKNANRAEVAMAIYAYLTGTAK